MKNDCSLKLHNLRFQELNFKRIGDNNSNEPKISIKTMISKKSNADIFKVDVELLCDKESEYIASVKIEGIFEILPTESFDEDDKNNLITVNAVAILMPYLRSELSLLTTQPDVTPIVLPPINITSLLKDVENL